MFLERSRSSPGSSIPDNSICIWGLNASGTNDNVSLRPLDRLEVNKSGFILVLVQTVL